MEYIDKKHKTLAAAAGVIYLLLIVLCVFFMHRVGPAELPKLYLTNIGIDIFAMLTGYMLFICCAIDVQKNGANLKFFMYLINVCFLNVFTDAVSWLVDGNPQFITANLIINTLFYMCGPLSACFLWMYVTKTISLNKPFEKKLGTVIQYGLIVPVALRIINIFTGIYFTIGESGLYARSPLYPLSWVYQILVLLAIAVTVISERKQMQTFQFVAIIMYILVPLAAAVLTLLFYGLSISGAVMMLVLLLMYCMINVTQGREKAIEDRDLKIAAAIQENILPRTFPFLPERKEFDIFATMTPAKEVGGDFYDFFMTDNDHLVFVIADVSGKGMPAALFMMVSRTLIKNQAQGAAANNDPAGILRAVNDQLCEGNSMEFFVTAWLGILTLSTGQLDYASAGHEYPAISKSGREFVVFKERNSPPLGTMEGIGFRNGTMELEAGDTVYVYTDGVTEATNGAHELFGLDRMLDALNADVNADLWAIDKNVRNSIAGFVGEAPQFDDITMLSVRYNGADYKALSEILP